MDCGKYGYQGMNQYDHKHTLINTKQPTIQMVTANDSIDHYSYPQHQSTIMAIRSIKLAINIQTILKKCDPIEQISSNKVIQ